MREDIQSKRSKVTYVVGNAFSAQSLYIGAVHVPALITALNAAREHESNVARKRNKMKEESNCSGNVRGDMSHEDFEAWMAYSRAFYDNLRKEEECERKAIKQSKKKRSKPKQKNPLNRLGFLDGLGYHKY